MRKKKKVTRDKKINWIEDKPQTTDDYWRDYAQEESVVIAKVLVESRMRELEQSLHLCMLESKFVEDRLYENFKTLYKTVRTIQLKCGIPDDELLEAYAQLHKDQQDCKVEVRGL